MDSGLPSALSAMSIDDNRPPKHRADAGAAGGGGDGGHRQGQHPGRPPQAQGHQQHQEHHHGQPPQEPEPQYPVITPDDLPPEMRDAFDRLDPDQQRQALGMLAQQQYEQQKAEEARPEEHFLTIALNGEFCFIWEFGVLSSGGDDERKSRSNFRNWIFQNWRFVRQTATWDLFLRQPALGNKEAQFMLTDLVGWMLHHIHLSER